MSIPSHNQQLVYVGDQGIEMADNDLLLLKTRVRNGLVSFHEDDIEARYPADWRVPGYILEELKRKGSNGKLFIISDEKGNLKSCIKPEKKDRFAGARNKALAFLRRICRQKNQQVKQNLFSQTQKTVALSKLSRLIVCGGV